MNLAYRYPIIYWNCACLSVDSSAINAQDFDNLIENDIINSDSVEGKKVQNKMDYSKLASALDKFGDICTIKLPNINKSKLSFIPDVETNTILYGLKGISRITEPVINEIMMNRPFKSLDDFVNKVTKRIVTKDKIINLIKCGAFNELEGKTTEELLRYYILSISEPKKRLTMQNVNMLIDEHLLPSEFDYECEVYKLTKELRRNRDNNKLWYCGDRLEIPSNKLDIWLQIVKDAGVEGKDMIIDDEPRRVMDSKKWDLFYDKHMNKIKNYLTKNNAELLKKLNDRLFDNEWQKYCTGDKLQWELDSMNFYFSGHPLRNVIMQIDNELDIQVDNVNNIVEGVQEGFFFIKGKEIPKMKLYTIAGTVIDRDSVKGLVTVQCPSGVVNLKVYKDLYATMAQVIGDIDENGKKDIEQDSFFEKGVYLLVTGVQRGATFVPKVYKNIKRNAIMKIVLDEEGNFVELEDKR